MKKIPITLITGFLGAGKSTLINRIISEHKGMKFGLIVNEFGDVKLESQIIKTSGEDIVELSNGCMCCVVRSDLVNAVDSLIKASPDIDYIIVEASGLSDPAPIAQTFMMQDLEKRIRLDSILCVIDSLNFEKNSENYNITASQIKFSDIMILSKVDLVPKEKVEAIEALIKQLVPESTILKDARAVDLDLIIDTSKYDHDNIKDLEIEEHEHEHENEDEHEEHEEHEHEEHEHEEHHHAHEHVETVFFKSSKKIDPKKFQELIDNLPEGIVRAKGFINFGPGVEQPEMKYVLQFVGARKQFLLESWTDGEEKQTALVFIGKDFDTEKLESSLKACEI